MSEQTLSLEDFQTKKLQSENGREYEAGVQTKASAAPAASEGESKAPSSLTHDAATVQVDWYPDGIWHTTSSDIQSKVGITSYIVGSSASPFYDYYVQFNTNWQGNNGFTDSGNPKDTYWCSVDDTSDSHIVRYTPSGGSNKGTATIKSVTYTP